MNADVDGRSLLSSVDGETAEERERDKNDNVDRDINGGAKTM